MVMSLGLITTAPSHAQGAEASELVFRTQELLEEVRELRGLVEMQQRELENLRQRQRDQYLDLDRRLQAVEQGGALARPADSAGWSAGEAGRADRPVPVAPVSEGRMPAESPADAPEVRAPLDERVDITPLPTRQLGQARSLESADGSEKAAYDQAFVALREMRYAEATAAFDEFLEDYPDSPYAANAMYWLAETYYVTREFSVALSYFNELLARFPDSGKHGDALLKIGFSHYELSDWQAARAALEQVRSQHPGTTLARLAESRLRDMRLAGHY